MGILIAILSSFLQSAKDLLSKRLAFDVGGTVSAFASFAYALPYYLALLGILWLLGWEDWRITGPFLQYVLLRASSDTAAEWLKMSALRRGDISLVSPFYLLSPLLLLFIAPWITGDQISPAGSLGVLVIVAGSVTAVLDPAILQPRGPQSCGRQWKAIALAILSSCFFALNSCFDKLAVSQASPALSGAVMTLFSAVFLAPFMRFSTRSHSDLRAHHRLFLYRGGLEVPFMVTKLWALQYLPAQYVVGIQRLGLLFSIIGGRIFYGEPNFRRRIFGAAVILLGTMIIIFAGTR